MHFLDEVLFQDVVHINDLPFLGDTQTALGILSSCVVRRPFNLTQLSFHGRLCPFYFFRELNFGGFVFVF
jgi:hypothetical protein